MKLSSVQEGRVQAPPGVPLRAGAVVEELARRGFRIADRGDRAVVERDGLQTVVPSGDRTLPAKVVHMLEFAFESRLGPGWLTAAPPAAPPRIGRRAETGSRAVQVVDAIVVHHVPGDPWCACLADDFTVIGFGDDRDEALRDLKRATALLVGVDPADIVLVTQTVL